MTLERDPAAVLVHERLQQAVSSMRAPDIEAGWAALAAQLEPPLAPVVPLRKPSRGRIVVLAVAAALLLAGSAFAAVSHFGNGRADLHVPSIAPINRPVTGPHIHEPFAGPPRDPRPSGGHHDGGHHPAGPSAGPTDGGGTSTVGGSGDGASKPGDDPNDRDQGTGNDGQHNDHGGGNNGAEGTKKPHESGGPSSAHGRSHH